MLFCKIYHTLCNSYTTYMTFVQHMRWDVGIRYWNTLSKALHAVKWSLVQRMNCDGFLRWVRHLCVKSAVVEKVSLCFCMVRGALEMEARIICLRAAPTKCIRTVAWFYQLFISLSSAHSFGLRVEKNILRKSTHQWLAISWVCKLFVSLNPPLSFDLRVEKNLLWKSTHQ